MGLLTDIQASLLNEQPIAPILLKLRFLAARLGSAALEEWVKYEAEGYPRDAAVPDYRKFPVSYLGNFNGPFGRTASNVPIPPNLVAEHAGENWLLHQERQSVSAIEDLIDSSAKSDRNLQINAADLVLILSDKIFAGMACHSIRGLVSRAALVGMIGALRARVLELVLELEKNVSGAKEIAVGANPLAAEPPNAAVVTHITNQIMNGPVGSNIANSGAAASFSIAVEQGNAASLIKVLEAGGIPASDAKKFVDLVASEKPDAPDQPFGTKTKAWIEKNVGKALNGTWKVGVAVATNLLTEAAKQYYGLN